MKKNVYTLGFFGFLALLSAVMIGFVIRARSNPIESILGRANQTDTELIKTITEQAQKGSKYPMTAEQSALLRAAESDAQLAQTTFTIKAKAFNDRIAAIKQQNHWPDGLEIKEPFRGVFTFNDPAPAPPPPPAPAPKEKKPDVRSENLYGHYPRAVQRTAEESGSRRTSAIYTAGGRVLRRTGFRPWLYIQMGIRCRCRHADDSVYRQA